MGSWAWIGHPNSETFPLSSRAVVCAASAEPWTSELSSQVSRNSSAQKYLTENSKISRHLILCGCRVFYDSLSFEDQQKGEGYCVPQRASYKCLFLLHMM